MANNNENPKIPSFKPTKKEEKKGAGPLSSLGKPTGANPPSSGIKWPGLGKGSPKMKVRGLPGGATIVDRLKNLRRKDMGFIAAGLSVLMMAPVAEHFMMTPQEEKGALTGGFDQKGPLFPDGTTIYENGTGGFSPGSLIGAGTDVITPLNVRDPAALVMGPGATQKPAATASPATEPPPKESNWKDALSQAATRGAKQATKSAKLPKPNVKMAGALRGLSALSGSSHGGGSSYTPPGLSAANVPNKARGSNSLTRSQAVPGYNGAARRSNSSSGSPESLRNSAGRQGDMFNQGGAATALDNASKTQIPGGGQGGGGGGPSNGAGGKSPGGSNVKESKSLGESLEFMRLKMEQEKALALKWKIKEWNTFGRQKMMEEKVIGMAMDGFKEAFVTPLGKAMGNLFSGALNPDSAAAKGAVCYIQGDHISYTNKGDSVYFCKGNTIYENVKGSISIKNDKCVSCKNLGSGGEAGAAGEGEGEQTPTTTIGGHSGQNQYNVVLGGLKQAESDIQGMEGERVAALNGVNAALKAQCAKIEGKFCTSLDKLRGQLEQWKTASDSYEASRKDLVQGYASLKTSLDELDAELGAKGKDKKNLGAASDIHFDVNAELQKAVKGYDAKVNLNDTKKPNPPEHGDVIKGLGAADKKFNDKDGSEQKHIAGAAAQIKKINDARAAADAALLKASQAKATADGAVGAAPPAVETEATTGPSAIAESGLASNLNSSATGVHAGYTKIGKFLGEKYTQGVNASGKALAQGEAANKVVAEKTEVAAPKPEDGDSGQIAGSMFGQVNAHRQKLANLVDLTVDKNEYLKAVDTAWKDLQKGSVDAEGKQDKAKFDAAYPVYEKAVKTAYQTHITAAKNAQAANANAILGQGTQIEQILQGLK
ncbi:MAG: hypothetical protein ABIJ96_03410 [Elusimicrobiota bacterium]